MLYENRLKGVVGEVRRHGIPDYAPAFYFLGVSLAFTWAVFCWISGHFPSETLLYAAIAHAAYQDQLKAKEAVFAHPGVQ